MQRLPLFSRVARLSGVWMWCNTGRYCVELALADASVAASRMTILERVAVRQDDEQETFVVFY